FIKKIKSKNLDFIVSYSAPSIFKEDLLRIPRYSCINLHCSLLPLYPGIMPSFWVLYFNERYTGSTVHLMDSKIDNGQIVLQERVEIDGIRSIFKLNQLTKEIGGRLMLESILGIVDQEVSLKKNKVVGSDYFTWPESDQIKRFIKNGGKIF
ncbi:formyltransferase family protein, partial [Akkermansiaceae bacterium]|nr:formyltransferase family protein [Akkermansiaceae bacterium]